MPLKTSRSKPVIVGNLESCMEQKSIHPNSKYCHNINSSRLSNVMHTQPYQHPFDFLSSVSYMSQSCIFRLAVYFMFIILISIAIGYGVYQALFIGNCTNQIDWRCPLFHLPHASCSTAFIPCNIDQFSKQEELYFGGSIIFLITSCFFIYI